MCTAVEKGLDGVFAGTHHNHRIGANIVDIGVSHIGQVLFATGPLPGSRPQLPYLPVKKRLGGIPLVSNIFITQEFITTVQQRSWCTVAIGRQRIGNGGPTGPGLAALRCIVLCHLFSDPADVS